MKATPESRNHLLPVDLAQRCWNQLTQIYGAPRWVFLFCLIHFLFCIAGRFVERRELEDAVKDLKYWMLSRFNQLGADPLAMPTTSFGNVVPGPSNDVRIDQVKIFLLFSC